MSRASPDSEQLTQRLPTTMLWPTARTLLAQHTCFPRTQFRITLVTHAAYAALLHAAGTLAARTAWCTRDLHDA
eukprot:9302882-Alexandrium_andersonii.AAC.1